MAGEGPPLRYTGRLAAEASARAALTASPGVVAAIKACRCPAQLALLLRDDYSARSVLTEQARCDDKIRMQGSELFSYLASSADVGSWQDLWHSLLTAWLNNQTSAAALQAVQKAFLQALACNQLGTATLLVPEMVQTRGRSPFLLKESECVRCAAMGALPPTRSLLHAVKLSIAARSAASAHEPSFRADSTCVVKFLVREIFCPSTTGAAALSAEHTPAASDLEARGSMGLSATVLAGAADTPGVDRGRITRLRFPAPCEHASPLEDPVHAAAAMGDADLLAMLAEAGYSLASEPPGWRGWPCPRIESLTADHTSRGERWFQRCSHDTALTIAVREGGSVAAVAALLDAGADPGAVSCCAHHASHGGGAGRAADSITVRHWAIPSDADALISAAAFGDAPAAAVAPEGAVAADGAAEAAALLPEPVPAPAPLPAVGVGAAVPAPVPAVAVAAGVVGPVQVDVPATVAPCSAVLHAVSWGRDEILQFLLGEPRVAERIDLQAIISAPLLPPSQAELLDQPAEAADANFRRRIAPLIAAAGAAPARALQVAIELEGRVSLHHDDACCWAVGRATPTNGARQELAIAAAAAARAAALRGMHHPHSQMQRVFRVRGRGAEVLPHTLLCSADAVMDSLAQTLRLPSTWARDTIVHEASLHGRPQASSEPDAPLSSSHPAASVHGPPAAPKLITGGIDGIVESRYSGRSSGIDVMAVLERVCPWTALHAASPRTVGLQALLQAIDSNKPVVLETLLCAGAVPAPRFPAVIRAYVAARAAGCAVPLVRGDELLAEAILRLRPELVVEAASARLPAAVHAMRLLSDAAAPLGDAVADSASEKQHPAVDDGSMLQLQSSASSMSETVAAATDARHSDASGPVADASGSPGIGLALHPAAAAIEHGIAAAAADFYSAYWGRVARLNAAAARLGDDPALLDDAAAAADAGARVLAADREVLPAVPVAPPEPYVRQEETLRLRIDNVVRMAAGALAARAWKRRRHALLCKAL